MPVATFNQTNFTTQDPTTYRGDNDGNWAVAANIVDAFAPHAATATNMTVVVDGGIISQAGSVPTPVAQQISAVLAAPVNNPRNDIVYVDGITGAMGVATGTEAAAPADPGIPAGKVAIARLTMTVGMASITNGIITDLRGPALSQSSIGTASASDTGLVNALSVAPTPIPATLTPGMSIWVTGIKATSTGAATMTITTGGGNVTIPIELPGAVALSGGELVVGYSALLRVNEAGTAATLLFSTGIQLGPKGGLNASSVATVTATGGIAASVAGGTVIGGTSAATTQTLPLASAVAKGLRIEFLNLNSGAMTVAANGTDTISANNGAVPSLVLAQGDNLLVESNGSNGWYAVRGTVVSALGSGQTWQDMKASRSLSTTYYNTTGRSIEFAVTNNSPSYISGAVAMSVNGLQILVSGASSGAPGSAYGAASVTVPAGASYSAAAPASYTNYFSWYELR